MTGLRFGVVATLGALSACNGRYEVGEGEGGEAGKVSETGGSSGAGTGGAGSGGSSNGGSDASGGTAGSSAGAGGGSPGGTGGMNTGGGATSACHYVPPESLPAYTPAAPEVVWERISRFLYDEARESDWELPGETTPEWVASLVGSILDAHHDAAEGAPAGLAKFIRTWAFDGSENETDVEWAAPLLDPGAGFLTGLFGPRPSDPARRSMLEDEAFLTTFPNPSLRGAWIVRNLMCIQVGSVDPRIPHGPAPAPAPSETRRQALETYTQYPTCAGCHYAYVNPAGFSLENYDETGAFREFDNGLPVDASGSVNLDVHGEVSFIDNADLLSQVAQLCEVGACVSSAFLDYAVEQAYAGEPPEILPSERQYVLAALASEYHRLRPMVLAVVTTPTFLKE